MDNRVPLTGNDERLEPCPGDGGDTVDHGDAGSGVVPDIAFSLAVELKDVGDDVVGDEVEEGQDDDELGKLHGIERHGVGFGLGFCFTGNSNTGAICFNLVLYFSFFPTVGAEFGGFERCLGAVTQPASPREEFLDIFQGFWVIVCYVRYGLIVCSLHKEVSLLFESHHPG